MKADESCIFVYSLNKYHLENGTWNVQGFTRICIIPLTSINYRKNTISSILAGSACALRTVRGKLRRLYIFLWFKIYSHKTQKQCQKGYVRLWAYKPELCKNLYVHSVSREDCLLHYLFMTFFWYFYPLMFLTRAELRLWGQAANIYSTFCISGLFHTS